MRFLEKLKKIESPKDLALLIRIACLAAILPFVVRWITLPNLLSRLSTVARTDNFDEKVLRKTILYTNYVLTRRFPLFSNTCLFKSLVLFRFLGEAGLSVTFNIGVKRGSGNIYAHSWITGRDGKCVGQESSASDFSLIYSLSNESTIEDSAPRRTAH
ncbi:lasso peptide biosynthesis B2 protein [Thermodesulfobacteriota bacterium]